MEVSETNALSITPGALLPLLTIRTSTAVRNEPDIVPPASAPLQVQPSQPFFESKQRYQTS